MIAVLLDLAIKGVKGAIRAINVIRDLLDDGKINESINTPEFLKDVVQILDQLEAVLDALKYPAVVAGAMSADINDPESEGHA